MMKSYLQILVFLSLLNASGFLSAQSTDTEEDARMIRSIYDHTLVSGDCYGWLEHLTTQIGARLGGSPQAAAAVEYSRQTMEILEFDSVWLQPCTVPHWVRGEAEWVRIVNSSQIGTLDLNALALGNSVGTPPQGITAEVIEVQSLEELESLGREKVEGKIVFFNRPMDPTQLKTFSAYGGAVDQRGVGASRASALGGVGALVRSMTTRLDDVPHTGGTFYEEGVTPVPALAISTNDAELLSQLLEHETVNIHMRSSAKMLSPKESYNVIGEIRGSTYPDEIILVGGHLDSWDVGQGAHDDGTGCVQSMQVLHTLLQMGYRPQRTIRCVLFMNEENGLAGGKAYWEASNAAEEYHMAAIESDRGGFTPRGFSCDAEDEVFTTKYQALNEWSPLLEPYGLYFEKGGSGADISGLKSQKGMLMGFVPDSQRYFDYHHTAIDTFDAVNKRELELGAAAMTSLVFLLDKYGL